jgi:ribosomal-protein-alanine N-acetyltransferase
VRGEPSIAKSGTDVRACRPEDLAAVLDILGQAPEAANWSTPALREGLTQGASCFLVAAVNDRLSGFAIGRRVADEGEILNLAVRPDCRRRGIGKALVEKLLEWFQHQATTKVFLEVRESNAAAIAFYQCLGFVTTGTRPGYYHQPDEAALILELTLTGNSA